MGSTSEAEHTKRLGASWEVSFLNSYLRLYIIYFYTSDKVVSIFFFCPSYITYGRGMISVPLVTVIVKIGNPTLKLVPIAYQGTWHYLENKTLPYPDLQMHRPSGLIV